MIHFVPQKPFLGMNAGKSTYCISLDFLVCVCVDYIVLIILKLIVFTLFRVNKNIVLATTKHGGHLAFFEGITASGLW